MPSTSSPKRSTACIHWYTTIGTAELSRWKRSSSETPKTGLIADRVVECFPFWPTELCCADGSKGVDEYSGVGKWGGPP